MYVVYIKSLFSFLFNVGKIERMIRKWWIFLYMFFEFLLWIFFVIYFKFCNDMKLYVFYILFNIVGKCVYFKEIDLNLFFVLYYNKY